MTAPTTNTVLPCRSQRSPFFREAPESIHHFVVKRNEDLLEMLLGLPGQLELHVSDLDDILFEGIVNCTPSDLLVASELGHRLLSCVMEANNDLHHPNCLRQWAHKVVLGEPVLLQEILANDFRHLERALL